MAKRTIRRRLRKSRTIRKVMRGCNGRSRGRGRRGGAKVEGEAGMRQATTFSTGGQMTNAISIELQQQAGQAQSDANAQKVGPADDSIKSNMGGSITTTTPTGVEGFNGSYRSSPAQVGGGRGSYRRGGAKTRHHKRKLRYKKSIARKSRHA